MKLHPLTWIALAVVLSLGVFLFRIPRMPYWQGSIDEITPYGVPAAMVLNHRWIRGESWEILPTGAAINLFALILTLAGAGALVERCARSFRRELSESG